MAASFLDGELMQTVFRMVAFKSFACSTLKRDLSSSIQRSLHKHGGESEVKWRQHDSGTSGVKGCRETHHETVCSTQHRWGLESISPDRLHLVKIRNCGERAVFPRRRYLKITSMRAPHSPCLSNICIVKIVLSRSTSGPLAFF